VIAYINLLLAVFNMIPIPPLDGSKVLSGILPDSLGRGYDAFRATLERLGVLQGTIVLLIVFYFLSPYFSAVLRALLALITGVAF
jgi:Zn-dependent protease